MSDKLTPSICYMAGLVSRSSKREKNSVGIETTIAEIEQRFIEIAIKDLEIEPTKILIDEAEGYKHIYFYHSRVAKRLKEIYSREIHVFKKKDKLSANYVAGMFDSAGRISRNSGEVSMTPITPEDAFMLENLGIHTKGNSIMNVGNLISLIGEDSILIRRISK
jgi:hypothetical protein